VITGASSGVGHDLAFLFEKRGFKVGLPARRREPLHELACEINDKNGIASLAECDVSDRVDVQTAIKKIVAEPGRD